MVLTVPCAPVTTVTSSSSSLLASGLVTSVQYTCTSGYQLIGAPTLLCRSDGTWNDSAPSCGMHEFS
ncbi:hypothetical protein DPMN_113983 [Dreissena polymorpha]|uniref:Sushi domain-containing protein n=1 Tax=Dreissena polymorpha TaxID=45954 RepID=A0A9D4KIG5_DREPO|nr:hypothetical protein DPMN_113983 [Dreissena polymorpha]